MRDMAKEHKPVKEVARKLNCDVETLRRRLRAGTLPGIRIGNEWRVDPDAVVLALSNSAGRKV